MNLKEIKIYIIEDIDNETRLCAFNGTKKQLNEAFTEYNDTYNFDSFDCKDFTYFMNNLKGMQFNFIYFNTY